jgi:hypothetical protein
MYILNYDCITAAGDGVFKLMEALNSGRDCSKPGAPMGRICQIENLERSKETAQVSLKKLLTKLWKNLALGLETDIHELLQQQTPKSRVALVFSSTKGVIEDTIWKATKNNIRELEDPFQCVIDDFCEEHPNFSWEPRCNVSNACASAHVACEYIQTLFAQDRADFAVLISADLVGPFVTKGFASLKIISPTSNRPFSADRDGLQLGEAASMVLFARKRPSRPAPIRLSRVASHTEGTSITRPSMNGDGLVSALTQLSSQTQVSPDLVIAHGTGTHFNDLAEELAFQNFLTNISRERIPITNTKWCIGHTLGASGSIDLIAACEILRTQRVFRIQNTQVVDPKFRMNYLTARSEITNSPSRNQNGQKQFRQILVTSLGFGGVHAGMLIDCLEPET